MGKIIQRISDLTTDEGKKGIPYKSRTLSIKAKGTASIKTPIRIINNQEIRAKGMAPAEVSLNSIAGIVDIEVGKKTLEEKFLLDNGYINSLVYKCNKYNATFTYFPLKMFYVHLTDDANTLFSTWDDEKQEKFIRILWRIFTLVGLDTFVLPSFNVNLDRYKELIKYTLALIEPTLDSKLNNIELVICVDPAYDKLDGLLKFIKEEYIDTKISNAVAIKARSAQSNIIGYDSLSHVLFDKEVLILPLGVNRRILKDGYDLSAAHYDSLELGDAFSLRLSRLPPKDESKPEPDVQDIIRFFQKEDVRVKKFREVLVSNSVESFAENIITDLGNINTDNRDFIRTSILNWNKVNSTKDEQTKQAQIGIFSALSKVHEVVTSNKEFSYMQKFISQRDTSDYINEKDELKKYIVRRHV